MYLTFNVGGVTDNRREKYIYTSLGKSGVIGDRKERLMIMSSYKLEYSCFIISLFYCNLIQ